MKRKKLNIGVIGIGYLGKYHLQKFITNRNCKTTWIVDLDPNNLSQNISDSIKKTTKYKDIVKDVDAVSIVTPTKNNYQIAKFFLENKKHVLIEKPMLLTEVNGALGSLYKDLGRLEESVTRHEAGIRISREVGNRRIESILMGNLALVLQLQGKIDDAKQMYEDTVRLDDTRGRTVVGHMAVGNLGDLLLSQGKLEESSVQLAAAIENMDPMRPSFAGAFRGSLAWAQAQMGEFEKARTLLDQGEAQLRDVWAVEFGRILCRRAQVEHVAASPKAAESALREAKDIAEKLGGSSDSDLGQMITETEEMLQSPTESSQQ